MSTYKNRVGNLIVGTPGTSALTLGSSVLGYQSFSAAYAADATVDILIEENDIWEIAHDCTYTHATGVLSRGTFEASSSGVPINFTSSAKVYVVETAYALTTQQTTIAAKANLASPTFTGTVAGITGSMVGLGNVDNTSDATKNAATATLTNKTFTGFTETVYILTGTDIAVANGTIQYKTLAANTTFTESLADGQAVTIMVSPSTYTITWPVIATNWVGGVTPTHVASKWNVFVLWQISGTVYGNYVGAMG